MGALGSRIVLLPVTNMVFAAGERPVLAPLAVPPMQHIQEMCTPAPEVVLAEFRVQKGIADPKAQLAAAPETIAEEQAAEAEEPVLTPRSGESQCIHVGNMRHMRTVYSSLEARRIPSQHSEQKLLPCCIKCVVSLAMALAHMHACSLDAGKQVQRGRSF